MSDRGGTLAQALFGFFIQFLRMRGGVVQWGYVPNDDSPLVRAAPNVQFIADANNAARFCAVVVNFNLAPPTASAARERVLKKRAAHSRLSSLMASLPSLPIEVAACEINHGQGNSGRVLFCNNL